MTDWIISSTVLMFIVIGLRTVLKGRVSLRLQYALWLLVLVRLLVPINLTQSALSILNAAETAAQTPVVQAITDVAAYRPPVQSFDEAYAQVVARYEAAGVDVEALTGSDLEALDYEAYEQMKADTSIGQAVADGLRVAWLAGMGVTALCLLGTNLRFAGRLRRSRRAVPVPGCPLPVYVTQAVDTPCLFGLVKPAIYLTADAPWDEKAMEHILTHELTHFRHGDHIWSVLRCVCLAVHWYNPLVWICAGLSRRDGELACDEASIRALGENRRAEYGRTLIEMTCQKPHGMVGLTATTMICSKKSLRERIQLIARHPKTAAYTLILVILIAALAVGCTFTGIPEETTEQPTETVTEPETQGPTDAPTEPEKPTEASTEPPTESEDIRLLAYQNLFHGNDDWIYNLATGYAYTRPEDVDLYYLFYNGVNDSGSWGSIEESERDLLLREGFWREMDIQIMPANLLEEKLRQFFGVGLDDVRIPVEWVYSSKTDTYYSNHNDAYSHLVTVTGYTDLPDGTVRLHLIVDAAHDHASEEFIWDAPMFMTLRPVENGDYQIVSNVFGDIKPPEQTVEADEKLEFYQTLLSWDGSMSYFRALGSVFAAPEDMDPYFFFYSGVDVPAKWDTLDAAERSYLLQQGLWEDLDIQKMPADRLDSRLQQYFGVGLKDVQIPDEWVYYPQTDCYYTNHSDAWLPYVTVTDYKNADDGTVLVFCTVDSVYYNPAGGYDSGAGDIYGNAHMLVTLRPMENGTYQMVSNVFAEDAA